MTAIFAPAKINLTLHVTGRRDDGYHLLDSLVVFAGVGDCLAAEPAADLSLVVDGPQAAALASCDDNIVLKAARLLRARAGIAAGARLRLTKVLPVASGIGGGSADAAATLKALAALWGTQLPAPEMHALALELGADVPVCLAGRPARMEGIGERITPVPALPPAWLVLTNPLVPLATPAVFKARTGPFSPPAPLDHPPRDAAGLAEWLRGCRNDLTQAAITQVPEIARALALLQDQPACLLARMSGSGATCFGLFATREAAETAARSMADTAPRWWHAPAPLLT